MRARLNGVVHVGLAVRDLDAALRLYRDLLGLVERGRGVAHVDLAIGQSAIRLIEGGEARAWLDAIDAPEGAIHHLRFSAAEATVVPREEALGLGIEVVAGNAAPGAVASAFRDAHNIDHVVISSNDSAATARWFEDELGLEMKRTMVRPGTGAQLQFARLSDMVLEFAGPPEPRPGPLQARYWGLVVRVTTLNSVLARLRAAGMEVTEPRAAVQPGATIATVKGGTAGVPFALIEYPPRA